MEFTPPVEIGAWLACATFMIMLFNQLAKASYTVRGKPTPIEQAKATSDISERVTKAEQRADEHARRLCELEREQRVLRDLIIAENSKLYNRINAVARDTNIMRGELTSIKENLALLIQRSVKP